MKKVIMLLTLSLFLCYGIASAQVVIDFESSPIDVLADDVYQATYPFFPGVVIDTVDNATGDTHTGWPVVVRAHEGTTDCDLDLLGLTSPGSVGAFDSRFCGSGNTTKNYPVPSGWNSLSDTSEGLPPSAGSPRLQDGYRVHFAAPASDVSVWFADWGDYFPNPNTVETHPSYIEVIALDKDGNQVCSAQGPQLNAVNNNRDAAKADGLIEVGCLGSGIRTFKIMFKGKIDPGVAIDDVTFTPPRVDLCAGQSIPVGFVSLWNDDTNLYLMYETTVDDWVIKEYHLDIGDIFVNSKGNPVPGQFEYTSFCGQYDPTTVLCIIPLDQISDNDGDPCLWEIAAHAVVEQVIEEAPYYAASVVSSHQGLRKNLTPVLAERSNPSNALIPDYTGGAITFFSLGFGGEIVVEFSCPVTNGYGDDVAIWEITNGTYPPESVIVYASQDGSSWVDIGNATNGRTAPSSGGSSSTMTTLDLGSLAWAKYIKIVDTSNPDDFLSRPDADSFDLDGIASLQDCVINETAWGDGCEGARITEQGNWGTYFTYENPGCNLE